MSAPNPRPQITRRTALCGVLVGLLAPAALAACSSDTGVGSTTTSSEPGTVLAAVADVPVGGGTVVDGPSGPVLLVQETAGTVTGYDASCPHAGTTVNAPVDGVVVCPNHGSEFDPATGAVEKGPARTGLSTVAVQVRGEQVVLA